MVKGICQWILYKRLGYKKIITQELPEKYIICMAPHTSNWDLILGQLFAHAEGIKCNFLMKKEWFFWPLGPIFRKMGGIPVWRSKHTSMTDNLAAEADKRKAFGLCITPRQIIPSGDVDKDMREIKLYFKDFKGKKPEKFTIGNID